MWRDRMKFSRVGNWDLCTSALAILYCILVVYSRTADLWNTTIYNWGM